MKIMLALLSCLAALACMGGCIPIGIKGSTMAGTAAPSCVAQQPLVAPGIHEYGAHVTPRCT
jgi:hypothetical protein